MLAWLHYFLFLIQNMFGSCSIWCLQSSAWAEAWRLQFRTHHVVWLLPCTRTRPSIDFVMVIKSTSFCSFKHRKFQNSFATDGCKAFPYLVSRLRHVKRLSFADLIRKWVSYGFFHGRKAIEKVCDDSDRTKASSMQCHSMAEGNPSPSLSSPLLQHCSISKLLASFWPNSRRVQSFYSLLSSFFLYERWVGGWFFSLILC